MQAFPPPTPFLSPPRLLWLLRQIYKCSTGQGLRLQHPRQMVGHLPANELELSHLHSPMVRDAFLRRSTLSRHTLVCHHLLLLDRPTILLFLRSTVPRRLPVVMLLSRTGNPSSSSKLNSILYGLPLSPRSHGQWIITRPHETRGERQSCRQYALETTRKRHST